MLDGAELDGRELGTNELDAIDDSAGTDELAGVELLDGMALLETLDELLRQTVGFIAQYASFQVSGGQSGQLLPCGQDKDVLLDDLELLMAGTEELVLVRKLLLLEEALEARPLHTDPVTGGR